MLSKTVLFVILYTLLQGYDASAQLIFSDQDSFEAYFANCNDCVRIGGIALTDDITDLSPLQSVRVIDGDLIIRDVTADLSMSNLNAIDSISGVFTLEKCGTTIIDFSDRGPILGGLVVANCDSLRLVRLANRQDTISSIILRENLVLDTLSVGTNIEHVSGSVKLDLNVSLRKMQLVPSVVSVLGDFDVARCTVLRDLGSSYTQLRTVGGVIRFASLLALDSISGFNSLTQVESVGLVSLSKLSTLKGFNLIEHTKGVAFSQASSPARLTVFDAFRGLQRIDGQLVISGKNFSFFAPLQSLQSVGTLNFQGVGFEDDLNGEDLFPHLTHLNILNIQSCRNCDKMLGFNSGVKVDSMILWVGNFNVDSLPDWHLDVSELDSLRIVTSRDLSYCSVRWVCDYLRIFSNRYEIGSNDTGCNSRNEIFQQCVFTDTKETEHEVSLGSIYPNPVRDVLHVPIDCEDCTYHIRDLTGSIVFTQYGQPIDVAGLQTGTYLLDIRGSEYTSTQRFVKL